MTAPAPRPTDSATDFLIKDFEHWAESYSRNEELGERRLTSFIGLVTAVLGGLALLAKHGDELQFATLRNEVVGALVGLAVLGLFTFLRILRRNEVTTGYLNAMREIRYTLLPHDVVDRYMTKIPRSTHRGFLNGGLAHIVIVIESGLLALLGWMLAPDVPLLAVLLAVGGILPLEIYRWFRERTGKRAQQRMGTRAEPQSFRANVGLVVVDSQGRVLALERRSIPNAWQLPQGGIEQGEEPIEAAYRELEEETGLKRRDVDLLAERPDWTAYELPQQYRSPKTGRGQVQKWFAFRAKDLSAFEPHPRSSPEASRLAWREFRDVMSETASFRQPVYHAIEPWVESCVGPRRAR